MKFEVGDRVRVYDGDVRSWLLGVVEVADEDGVTVRTDLKAHGMPLLFHIPSVQGLERLLRKAEK